MIGASTLLGVSMEESGVTKVISVRLENRDETSAIPLETYAEEEVEAEDGRQLPQGVDDPALVSAEDLRPIRGGLSGTQTGNTSDGQAENASGNQSGTQTDNHSQQF
jgi:chromosome segregation protein